MPATKDTGSKYALGRSTSHHEMSMSARVYHPATNLMPPTPPQSPTGVAPSFATAIAKSSSQSWSRQNSSGKYS